MCLQHSPLRSELAPWFLIVISWFCSALKLCGERDVEQANGLHCWVDVSCSVSWDLNCLEWNIRHIHPNPPLFIRKLVRWQDTFLESKEKYWPTAFLPPVLPLLPLLDLNVQSLCVQQEFLGAAANCHEMIWCEDRQNDLNLWPFPVCCVVHGAVASTLSLPLFSLTQRPHWFALMDPGSHFQLWEICCILNVY